MTLAGGKLLMNISYMTHYDDKFTTARYFSMADTEIDNDFTNTLSTITVLETGWGNSASTGVGNDGAVL